MAIPKGAKANFATLQRAVRNGDAALMECKDKKTGETVDVICAARKFQDGSVQFVPLASMIRDNPYDRFEPPT